MSEHEDPFRLRVLKALANCLAEITIENGYKHDLTGAVFRGRDLFGGESDPVPMISILEPPLPIDQLVSPPLATSSTGDWDLLIQGFCKDDHENPTDPGHLLMADVKRRLAVEKQRIMPESHGMPDPFGMGRNVVNGKNLSNVVKEIVIGPGVVRPPGDGVSDKAYFWLTLTLKIAEDMEHPFL